MDDEHLSDSWGTLNNRGSATVEGIEHKLRDIPYFAGMATYREDIEIDTT